MTEAMPKVKFSSKVFRVFMMTDSVCVLLATVLSVGRGEGETGGLKVTVNHSF